MFRGFCDYNHKCLFICLLELLSRLKKWRINLPFPLYFCRLFWFNSSLLYTLYSLLHEAWGTLAKNHISPHSQQICCRFWCNKTWSKSKPIIMLTASSNFCKNILLKLFLRAIQQFAIPIVKVKGKMELKIQGVLK